MAETTTVVDLSKMSEAVAELLIEAREDFEDRLERVQDVVEAIKWEKMRKDTLTDEIGEITFENYTSVFDLVKELVFTPLKQQELLETDIQKSKKHVFISESLDAAEASVINMTKGGFSADGAYKDTTNVCITDEVRRALIAGERFADERDANAIMEVVNKYQSSDHTGNVAWLGEQYTAKILDRERNIFRTLFTMAQANVQWAFNQGIAIEKLHESFTARYNRLYLDLTSANIAAYKAEVRGNIAVLEAQIKRIDAQMQVESLKFDAESAEWALKIEQANSRLQTYVQEYSGKMSRNLKMVNTRMVGGKNVADGYKSIYSAYSSQYSGVSLSDSGSE